MEHSRPRLCQGPITRPVTGNPSSFNLATIAVNCSVADCFSPRDRYPSTDNKTDFFNSPGLEFPHQRSFAGRHVTNSLVAVRNSLLSPHPLGKIELTASIPQHTHRKKKSKYIRDSA